MIDFVNRVVAWFESRDRGASAVEYALIVGAIAAVVAAFVFILGGRVNGLFNSACQNITQAADACTP